MKKDVHPASEKLFWYWLNERQRIYNKREHDRPWPWTKDPILQTYKFTNVFRENDKTTVWMRNKLTKPNDARPLEEILFNCCVFRLFGTMEMGKVLGWIKTWKPNQVKRLAKERLQKGEKVFTGAYIITNGGISAPKYEVVVDRYLTPIWEQRNMIIEEMMQEQTLEHVWKVLHDQSGFGGGGFMAYEVVSDLRWTRMLKNAKDVKTWANAGPGCLRGLRRLFNGKATKQSANGLMQSLLKRSGTMWDHSPGLEMREIEHSLCEFDKYCRVKYGEGTPRSLYHKPGFNSQQGEN